MTVDFGHLFSINYTFEELTPPSVSSVGIYSNFKEWRESSK